MEKMPATLWIAACAHRLQQRWHTVDVLELEEVARDLARRPVARHVARRGRRRLAATHHLQQFHHHLRHHFGRYLHYRLEFLLDG
jgi:hypothetical protein